MPYPLIVANLLMVGIFVLKITSLPPQIPIFFSRPWGEAQLADWWLVFIIPLLMNILYFTNRLIVKRYYNHNEFAHKLVDYFNLFMIVIFTFIFIRIIFLIT